MVFSSNKFVTATERDADGTTVYDHVFEDKGCKITVNFNILDGPSIELETQLSRVNQAAKEVVEIKSVRDRLGISIDYLEGVMKLGEFISEVSSDWTEILIDTLSFGFRSSILQ